MYKVGDKVICRYGDSKCNGTIVSVLNGKYLVHSNDFISGHNGLHPGHIQYNNNNYWLMEGDFEVVNEQLSRIDGEMQDLHMKLHYVLKEECRGKGDEYCKDAEKVKELLAKSIDALQVLLSHEND